MKGHRSTEKRLSTCSISVVAPAQLLPSARDIVWPDLNTIHESQQGVAEKPAGISFDEDTRIWRRNNRIWIPDNDSDLQLKVIVASHCGACGHRAIGATESIIRESFDWSTLHEDVSTFVKGCLHCLVSQSGEIVPRPLGTALHVQQTNEVVHLDYLFMGPSKSENRYLLLMRDDLSGYIWL